MLGSPGGPTSRSAPSVTGLRLGQVLQRTQVIPWAAAEACWGWGDVENETVCSPGSAASCHV